MANDVRLSQSSTEMFDIILEEMRNYKFDSINFPLLLYGVLNVETDDEHSLENYLFNNETDPTSIENNVSDAISDYVEKLKSSYVKEHPDETANLEKENIPMIHEHSNTLIFTDFNGDQIKLPVNSDITNVYGKLLEIIEKFSVTQIEPIHFTVAMFMVENKILKNFFQDMFINYLNASKYFKPEHILCTTFIPFALEGFLSTINDKIDASKPCEILNRDKESELLWNIMLKRTKRNAVLVGEAGVGKTALIEKITYDIKKGVCPEEFKNFNVISLDVNALIAGTSYRGDAEERINDLISFLKKNNEVILFIDEVHTILGAGSCFEGEMDLANALKPILARGDTIVIGATTNNEYEMYFKTDSALSRRFEKIEIKEPLSKNVYPMIKNKIDFLSDFHKVHITKEMVQFAILIANCFAFEKKNPDKTLDLIDRAMVTAKRDKKGFVDKKSILKNFDIFFKMWDNMSDNAKKEIAYHEAGHYIVAKASGRLTNRIPLAISIMPAEDYLGITVYEVDDEIVPFSTIDYYVDTIAVNLAGRVAENIFSNNFTGGAGSDLNTATKTAFYVVTKLGMGNDSIKNRIYLNSEDYPMFSEKSTNNINDKVNELIEKAYKRAKELLEENRDILEAIVSALLKKHIMSEKELDKIWQRVVKKRNI